MAGIISVVPGQCELVNNFVCQSRGYAIFDRIHEKAEWQQNSIKLFGKTIVSPRLSAWYGNRDAVYRYSGIENIPLPWFEELLEIRGLVEDYTRNSYNSVLLNLYRDGKDSMGRHCDDESDLGANPEIASVSLGATRRFILHPGSNNKHGSIKLNLAHGSLLIMSGNSQSDWKHSIPKTRKPVRPWINLTFRSIVS